MMINALHYSQQEAEVFKTNVNSRDLNGWNVCAIAVFHERVNILRLLLEHGGNPMQKSAYNKSAWDLSQDVLDAAMKVVKSNAEIRQVGLVVSSGVIMSGVK